MYKVWACRTTNGAEPLTDELPGGAKLHGGPVLPLPPALVPEYPFPKQVRQALAAVQHLLDAGTPPSELILIGDSAGGNLALQIAAQLLHPDPSLPAPPAGPLCLGGLLLLSRWMEFGTDAPSHTRNAVRDVLSLCTYQLFAPGALPGVAPELHVHLEPAFADGRRGARGAARFDRGDCAGSRGGDAGHDGVHPAWRRTRRLDLGVRCWGGREGKDYRLIML
ncbi:hypothetical protein BJY52DRAFT_1270840 [Lactarius psammicola]|nr:hypothetical protein BJY52DRAFT_1270840 [Lactarius psammicola]